MYPDSTEEEDREFLRWMQDVPWTGEALEESNRHNAGQVLLFNHRLEQCYREGFRAGRKYKDVSSAHKVCAKLAEGFELLAERVRALAAK